MATFNGHSEYSLYKGLEGYYGNFRMKARKDLLIIKAELVIDCTCVTEALWGIEALQ